MKARYFLYAFLALLLTGLSFAWSIADAHLTDLSPYAFNVLIRRGGTYWQSVTPDSPSISPSMRLAFGSAPVAQPEAMEWKTVGEGFDVAELPALVDGKEVDSLYLARIDPAHFRFAVYNSPGDRGLDQWVTHLGNPVLVVNGSYYGRHAEPDTPFLSEGKQLGPVDYDGKAGAFVSSAGFTGIRDLSHQDWQTAFEGADNAMVSYPMLVADGATHVLKPSQWLANRSFVGQDRQGRIIIGTSKDAFFTLDALAKFLLASPLNLDRALNLDGGPIASQAISLNGFTRKTYGQWEMQAEGRQGRRLSFLQNRCSADCHGSGSPDVKNGRAALGLKEPAIG